MVRQIDVLELSRMLAAGERCELLDVRTPGERAVAAIEAAVPLDDEVLARVAELPRDTPLVFLCHHGMRSQQAAMHFAAAGFSTVMNVEGGIDAWSRLVDPAVPRY